MTSIYMPNFIEIQETFCKWMDVHMHIHTYARTFETGFIRSTLSKSRSKKTKVNKPQKLLFVKIYLMQVEHCRCWSSALL